MRAIFRFLMGRLVTSTHCPSPLKTPPDYYVTMAMQLLLRATRAVFHKRAPSSGIPFLPQDATPEAILRAAMDATADEATSKEALYYLAHRVTTLAEECGDGQRRGIAADRALQVVQSAEHRFGWSEQLCPLALRAACAAGSTPFLNDYYARCKSQGWLRHRNLSPVLRHLCRQVLHDRSLLSALDGLCGDAAAHNVQLDPLDYEGLVTAHRILGSSLGVLHHILSRMADEAPLVTAKCGDVIAEWAGSRCHFPVVSADGVCGSCRATLVGMPFTSQHKSELLCAIHQQVIAKRPSAGPAFDGVIRLLADRTDVTAVIDGANVGYYGLTSWYPVSKRRVLERTGEGPISDDDPRLRSTAGKGGFVDVPPAMDLIDVVMRELAAKHGLTPIVVLHPRHVEDALKDPVFNPIVNQWRACRQLYVSPKGVYDDVIWLYCALHHTVPTDVALPQGVRRVFVVSNDKMRDHLFAALNRTVLERWRSRHQVEFRCSFEDGRSVPDFIFPKPFGECIQFNHQLLAWHVPVDGGVGGGARWMCIQ